MKENYEQSQPVDQCVPLVITRSCQKLESCFWRNSRRLREASTPKMVRREMSKTEAVIVSMAL